MENRKIKLLMSSLQGKKRFFIGAMIATLASVILGFLSPLVMRTTIDSIIQGNPMELPQKILDLITTAGGREMLVQNMWIPGLILVLISIISGVCQFLVGRWSAVGSERVAESLRNKLYTHLAHLPYNYHVKAETGDLIQRCSSDVETVRRFLSGQMVQMLRSVSMLVFAIIIMFSLNGYMTMMSMLMIPFIFLFSLVFFKKVINSFRIADEAEGALTATLQENLTGMRVVRAFGRQQYEVDKFGALNRDFRDKSRKLLHTSAFFWSASDLMCMVQTTLVLVIGAMEAAQGRITLGTMIAFTQYEDMLLWPVRQLGRLLSDMGKAMVSLERIDEVLREKEEKDHDGAIAPDLQGDICFENVTFSYDGGRKVLDNVSFTAKQGQTVAILGPTGSGKSTMMYLLQRLYDAQEGKITINGTPIEKIQKKYLRSRVGIVLQEPFLYSRTIRENVAIIDPSMEDEDVFAAAKVAHVHHVVEEFDNGYDTVVGERGVTLSGGQKQRVAIARTLVRDNDVLIFDDSLSAVDTQTDTAIRKALGKRTSKTTTFIISHRVTTLSEADVILVLEDGKIVQQGTHDELLAQEGLYKRIAHIQTDIDSAIANS